MFENSQVTNYLTIDVEDWFHVSGYADAIPHEQWEAMEQRLPASLSKTLDLLDANSTKATFFILGWVAEHNPDLVKAIMNRGHEIASHGYGHELVTALSSDQFRDDLRKGIDILSAITGSPIIGYRAPSFSITVETPWAFPILLQAGIRYDSSVYPIRRRRGGISSAPLHPYDINTNSGVIREFPIAACDVGPVRIPLGGGGYFRFYPYSVTAKGIRKLNRQGIPAVFYLHPWELDPDQPSPDASSWRQRWKHRLNLRRTESRLQRLLKEFRFQPLYKGL